MISTDPSYDNRTIASTLKMQIWIATNNRDVLRVMKTKFPATVMVFGVVSSEGHIMPPHIFVVGLKVNTKVYLDVLKSVVIPWCNQVAGGRYWVWQQDSAPAHKSKETQAWLQKGFYDFVSFSHCPPLLPRPDPAGLLHLVIRREHHQHDHPQHQRRWLRLKVATLNRCQLYYIIKLPELIFSIKVFLNNAVVLFSFGRQFYHSTQYKEKFKIGKLQARSMENRKIWQHTAPILQRRIQPEHDRQMDNGLHPPCPREGWPQNRQKLPRYNPYFHSCQDLQCSTTQPHWT